MSTDTILKSNQNSLHQSDTRSKWNTIFFCIGFSPLFTHVLKLFYSSCLWSVFIDCAMCIFYLVSFYSLQRQRCEVKCRVQVEKFNMHCFQFQESNGHRDFCIKIYFDYPDIWSTKWRRYHAILFEFKVNALLYKLYEILTSRKQKIKFRSKYTEQFEIEVDSKVVTTICLHIKNYQVHSILLSRITILQSFTLLDLWYGCVKKPIAKFHNLNVKWLEAVSTLHRKKR